MSSNCTRDGRMASAGHAMARATMIMMIALIASKVTGQLRDIIAVNRFGGSGALSDAYFQGFLIPDFIYEILIGGSIQAAIVPTLSGALGTEKERSVWRSVSVFVSFFSTLMLATVAVCEVLAPVLMGAIARPDVVALSTQVARRLFPQTFFMMLAALCIGILNAYQQFSRTAFGPVFYNSLVVSSLLIFGAPNESAVRHAAIGITISAAAYFVFQAALGRRQLSRFRPSLDVRDDGFRRLLWLAVPTLISSSIPQINNIVLNALMKTLPEGTPTLFKNATTLWMLPWGVFAVAIGTVMLPALSRSIEMGDHRTASRLLSRSLNRALFLNMPCAFIFLFLRNDVVRAVFKWSAAYTEADVVTAGNLLGWFCLTIITHTFVSLLNQAFYAAKKTFMPLINSAISLALTTGFGALLSRPSVLGASGLSLGYALGSLLGAVFMMAAYRRMMPACAPRRVLPFMIKALIACIAIVGVLAPVQILLDGVNPPGKLAQLAWLAARALPALAVYGAVAHWMDMREMHELTASIQAKFKLTRSR